MAKLSDQEHIRRQRRQDLLAAGVNVYPARSNRSHAIQSLLSSWGEGISTTIAGRIMAIRPQGGSVFLGLRDETGELQVFFQKKKLKDFATLSANLDLGDFIEVAGQTFVTNRGEKTLDATTVTWLAKALRPLPSAWHGLADIETRYRYRELDLLANDEVKKVFLARGKILSTIRDFLQRQEFTEVETPVLQSIAGGASARPFVTHHNALDIDLFLRIAPELYLKRLIVGGLGRVYEIGRNFRNEGIDRDHNPEFTMLECYAAYSDYQWMMDFTENLLLNVVTALNGRSEILVGNKHFILKKPFKRISYHEAVRQLTGIDIEAVDDDELRRIGREKKTELRDEMNRPQMIDEIFKTHVRPNFLEPVFVYDYPTAMIPLAKKKYDNPAYVECFQLLGGGTELAKGFSELNDPVDQRQRFEAQEVLRAAGDDEAQTIDETYLRSLEYGLPPTSGLGIGIDRLTAFVTNQSSLKDVILFPTLKPDQS